MKCLEGLCLQKCAVAKKSVESQIFEDAIFSHLYTVQFTISTQFTLENNADHEIHQCGRLHMIRNKEGTVKQQPSGQEFEPVTSNWLPFFCSLLVPNHV